MADDDQIIIKKIKKAGHGHHGGAWKVAYADFVTAMMAFFLMLWLLSTTSPEQKAGLADYFTPTTGLQDARGVGTRGGLSASPEGRKRTDLTEAGIVVGRLPQGPTPDAPEKKIDDVAKDQSMGMDTKTIDDSSDAEIDKKGNNADSEGAPDEDSDEFNRVEDEMMNAFEQTPELEEFKDNVMITHSPEGLKIDIVDSEEKPMFAPGSALITDSGKQVIEAISNIVATTSNKISISGHTDSNYLGASDEYTSWELSADRANASRRHLASVGLEVERFAKVQGLADQEHLVPEQPNSPRNRRISLTLMRGTHIKETDVKATSRGLLSLPDISPPPEKEAVIEVPEAAQEPDLDSQNPF